MDHCAGGAPRLRAIWLQLLHATERQDPTCRVGCALEFAKDVPQAFKGPGFPATANPGEAFFLCDITNVGMVGVKIREAYVWIDARPGKLIPLLLPQEAVRVRAVKTDRARILSGLSRRY